MSNKKVVYIHLSNTRKVFFLLVHSRKKSSAETLQEISYPFVTFLVTDLIFKGKHGKFALKIKGTLYMISIEDKIFARIKRKGRGWVMTNRDFTDLANSSSVDWCLYRLKDKKIIRPILRGIYDYPKFSELLQEELVPELGAVAQAIARKNQWHIQISGSAALNFLGLSTQIPMRTVYFSDGPNRNFEIGERILQFKHILLKANFPHLKVKSLFKHCVNSEKIMSLEKSLKQ